LNQNLIISTTYAFASHFVMAEEAHTHVCIARCPSAVNRADKGEATTAEKLARPVRSHD
jgi:hypothetical protein